MVCISKLYLQKRRARGSDISLLGHHPSKPLDLNTTLVILSHYAVLKKMQQVIPSLKT